MAKPKKRVYVKKSFESNGASNDTSANIFMSMLLSPAWQDLTLKQQSLYVYLKAQYYGQSGNRAVDRVDNTKFYFNKALWQDVYKLYNKGSEKRFYNDVKALIEHGFIRCLESGKNTKTKNIYQYSDKWKKWNTDAFELLPSELNSSMLKALTKENKA